VTEFDKVIPPGGVGKVTASVDTSHFKGQIAKSVTVTTNDPAAQRTTLTLKADVRVPVDVQPSETAMFQGRVGHLTPVVLTISSSDDAPFDIVSIEPSDASVTATVVPAEGEKSTKKTGTLAAGAKKYVMTVSASPSLKVGTSSGQITVKTTHPKAPELPLRFFANVTGNVQLQPERVMMNVPATMPPEGLTQHVVLRRAADAEGTFDVKSASSSDERVTVKVTTTKAGEEYDLAVGYKGAPPTSSTVANVTVETTDSLQPTLTIPVYVRSGNQTTTTVTPMVKPIPMPAPPPGH
jgi:hypothetical protein